MGPLTAPEPHHPDCLHCAWDGVVAALPEGWRMEDLYRSSVGGDVDDWWHVLAVEPYTADGTSHEGEQAIMEGHGPSAVEALRSLTLTALRAALLGERG